MPIASATIVACVCLLIGGCQGRTSEDPKGPSRNLVRVDFDRKDPKSFVEFYFSPFVRPGSVFESGVVIQDGDDFMLDIERLSSFFPPAAELLADAADRTLIWEEMKPFFNRHYYDAIEAPESLSGLMETMDTLNGSWMEFEVDGVMTAARRHVLIPREAVRQAISNYRENDDHLLYPDGTVIVADHTMGNEVIETTAMIKRADRLWDFVVFDAEGNRATSTISPPKELRVPTQCAGCHLGTRLYEPEESFPGRASPGPEGPREVHVSPDLKKPEIVRVLDEHRKRSDGILGLYGTLLVSELVLAREQGSINAQDAALLEKLGF